MKEHITCDGFSLQKEPRVYITSLPGKWLLRHSTPSWRLEDPIKGFQRIVSEERVRKIAVAVLDQRRNFPNAIILATDLEELLEENGTITLPSKVKFLVVDGQHRLWAQKFSDYEANYACLIHMGLNEKEMAKLFLEINDNQKRVPSSLRWDLVRLVRPDDDPYAIAAADLVAQLNSEPESPLHQRIDQTGEQPELRLKQGSLAPEIKSLVSMKLPGLKPLSLEGQYEVLLRYLAAIRGADLDGWREGNSPFCKARVLRTLLKLLPLIIKNIDKPAEKTKPAEFQKYLSKIDISSLSDEEIKSAQGSAGMREIYVLLKNQMGL